MPSDHSAAELLHAAAVSGGEATVVDGEMVDVPVILRARIILHSPEQQSEGASA
ncbi:hypothetical protein D3C85_1719460 [compost metagenome]